jgi:hypothetical protein
MQIKTETLADIPGMDPPRMLIEGLIPVGAIAVVAGPSYSGKTFVGLEAASAYAYRNRAFMGRFDMDRPADQKHVLFIQQDAPRYDTGRALWAMNPEIPWTYDPMFDGYAEIDPEPDEQEAYWYAMGRQHLIHFAWHQGLDLTNEDHCLNIIDTANGLSTDLGCDLRNGDLRRAEGTGLIIFDSFRSVHTGAEDKSDEMEPVIANLKSIRAATNATIMVIHHAPKDPKDHFGLRGSTAIEAGADVVLKVVQDKKTELVSVTAKKARSIQPEDFDFKIETVVNESREGNDRHTVDVFKTVRYVPESEKNQDNAADDLNRQDDFLAWIRHYARKRGSVSAVARRDWAVLNEVPTRTMRHWTTELKKVGALKDGANRGDVLPFTYEEDQS